MTVTFESIEAAALELPERDRIHLAHLLVQSVAHSTPEIEEAWLDEVERRIELQNAGKISEIDADDLYRELRRR
jgi:putative addiction module component (TIGR02574 family)